MLFSSAAHARRGGVELRAGRAAARSGSRAAPRCAAAPRSSSRSTSPSRLFSWPRRRAELALERRAALLHALEARRRRDAVRRPARRAERRRRRRRLRAAQRQQQRAGALTPGRHQQRLAVAGPPGSGTPSSFRTVGARSMMCGLLARDLAVREEHAAADLGRGRAVVAAPLAVVVLDDRAADAAERVLPAHAVAVVEADLQVGRVLEVLALVDVVARGRLARRPARPCRDR